MNEKGEETIMAFVHLHTHTEYSLLDGSNKIKEYVSRVKELGMNSAAITDHGNMYGVVEFYKTAKAADINPVIGCEIYVAPNSRFDRETSHGEDRYYHLILLAENNTGYANLMKIVSIGFTEGYYYRPRVDFETLQKYHEGLICLSACLAGEVPRYIVRGFYEEAKGIAKKYQDCFGKDNYFLELQDHGIPDQKTVNQGLLRISQELDIPLVCTNDIHYTYETDVEAHDVLLCIQTGKKITDEDRMRYEGGQFFVKSEEQMRSLFPYAKEAADNTQKIADRCHVTLEFGNYQIPKYAPPEGYDSAWTFLNALCEKGFQEKYTDNPAYDKAQCAKIHEDMEYELGIIQKMGFVEYILIVWDYINWAKTHDCWVGPGRGSGAGSRVCYCTGITNIDPVKYNLLFERFLNPAGAVRMGAHHAPLHPAGFRVSQRQNVPCPETVVLPAGAGWHFEVKSSPAAAVLRYALSCENSTPGRPQSARRCSINNIFSAEHGQSEAETIKIVLTADAQTRTISRVISLRLCAPHICMVSASSPAILSM